MQLFYEVLYYLSKMLFEICLRGYAFVVAVASCGVAIFFAHTLCVLQFFVAFSCSCCFVVVSMRRVVAVFVVYLTV